VGRHFLGAVDEIADLCVIVALLYHAWVGMREIFMDYIKPVYLRLALQVFSIVWLVAARAGPFRSCGVFDPTADPLRLNP
jgi:succinate dehydrogenase hydrophobic membrane anchor protein